MNTEHTHQHDAEPFGPVVYSYTRAQAVADGFQVEVTKTASEAGITFPVFLTRSVFDSFVAVPPGVTAQDEAGRLWDMVWMLRFAIRRIPSLAPTGGEGQGEGTRSRLPFALYVRNDNRAAKLVKLIATCGPLDLDDPQPAITVMLPDEDRRPRPSLSRRTGEGRGEGNSVWWGGDLLPTPYPPKASPLDSSLCW